VSQRCEQPAASKSIDFDAFTDEQLAERLQAGCTEAFGPLFERLRPRLVHFLWQRTGNRTDAEDVAHDAFIRAYEKIDQYNGQYRFTTWLFTIASRIAIDQRRRRKPAVNADALGPLPDHHDGPTSGLVQNELRDNLWAIAARVLNESQHTALWLRYGEELEIDEIASILDKSAVGIRVLLMRARNKLAPHVKQLAAPDVQNDDEPAESAARLPSAAANGVAS
jgi:RNA polymerase sigma-70 factor (ECF subfamily)